MRGQGQIIGSASSDNPHMMYVNNSGAIPVAGYNAGVVHPLLVDGAGALVTSASVTVGSVEVNVGSEAFMFGSSGTGWNSVLVDADGKLETTASVTVDSVFIASGADIGSVNVNNFDDLGSTVVIDAPTTIGSLAVQTIDGTISANVNSPATVGSYTTQTVDATNLDIRDLSSASDSVTAVQATQANLKSEVYQGTDPWITLGSTNINNASAIGSLGVQDVSLTASSATVQVSGDVTISNDNYINIAASGTTGVPVSGDFSVTVDSVFIASGADIGSVFLKDGAFVSIIASGTTGVPVSGDFSVTVDSVFIASGADIGSVNVNNFADLGSTVVIDAPATIGSLAIQTVDGTVAISTSPVQVSGDVTISNDSYINIAASGTTGIPISGVVGIVGGQVADDATTPGNPIMIGGVAKETDGTDPSSVSAEDDVTRIITDRNRRMMVNTAHPNGWVATDSQTSAQTSKELQVAPGANLSLYLTDMIISNGDIAGEVKIIENSGTPVDIIETMYFDTNSGMSKRFNTPIRLTANENIGYTSTTVGSHSITLIGYIAP